MKKNIVILIVLVICACSSVPKIERSESLNTLIQKPDLNYKIRSLPRTIKVYFNNRDDEHTLPPEVQGFIANSYFYNSKIFYKPKISFSYFQTEDCNNQLIKEDLIIVFNLQGGGQNLEKQNCFKSLPKSKTLYVADTKDNFGFGNNFC